MKIVGSMVMNIRVDSGDELARISEFFDLLMNEYGLIEKWKDA